MTGGEDGALEDMVKVDLDDSRWLAWVLDDYGWTGKELVGDDGARAAWLLALHADHDPAFQRQCLDLLYRAVAEGKANSAHLAYLTDRVELKQLGLPDLWDPVPSGHGDMGTSAGARTETIGCAALGRLGVTSGFIVAIMDERLEVIRLRWEEMAALHYWHLRLSEATMVSGGSPKAVKPKKG